MRGTELCDKPFSSIQEEIDVYVEAISNLYPIGEINIIGMSGGGNVAHEIACIMEERGRVIRFVGLIDSSCPINAFSNTALSKQMILSNLSREYGVNIEPMSDYTEMSHIFWRRLVGQNMELGNVTLDVLDRIIDLVWTWVPEYISLSPRKGNFKIIYFSAEAQVLTKEQLRMRSGWSEYCCAIRYVPVQTIHVRMLYPDALKVIVPVIDDALSE